MPRITRTKKETEILDLRLLQIVQEHRDNYGKTIDWKKICQKLFLKYSIKLNNKQCAQRYKDYSSKVNEPSLDITSKQEEEIFMRHCRGQNGKKIRFQMNLQSMSQNAFKNILKKMKERIGRILKQILSQNFLKIDFDCNKFSPKDQFRVMLILFSTAPLLNHYYLSRGIKILDFKNKVLQYESQSRQVLKNTTKQNLTEEQLANRLQKIETFRVSILKDLERIFDVFEIVYQDSYLSKQLIGLRELKNMQEKYIYAKAVIFDMSVKVCRDKQDLLFNHRDQQYKGGKSLEEGHQQRFTYQQFGNTNFFETQIIDGPFEKIFHTFSASSKKNQFNLRNDEDTSPKDLFMQQESDNHFDRFFV